MPQAFQDEAQSTEAQVDQGPGFLSKHVETTFLQDEASLAEGVGRPGATCDMRYMS